MVSTTLIRKLVNALEEDPQISDEGLELVREAREYLKDRILIEVPYCTVVLVPETENRWLYYNGTPALGPLLGATVSGAMDRIPLGTCEFHLVVKSREASVVPLNAAAKKELDLR